MARAAGCKPMMSTSRVYRLALFMAAVGAGALVAAAATFGLRDDGGQQAAQLAARAPSTPECVSNDAHLVAARGQVAVYRTAAGDVRVCNAQRNDITLVTDGPGLAIFAPPVLQIRGNLVAYVRVINDGPDLQSVDIQLLDLDDRNPDTMIRSTKAGTTGFDKVASLRLSAHGSVAWIACYSHQFPPQLTNGEGKQCYRAGRRTLVIKAHRVGNERQLDERIVDSGTTITPTSLRLNGRTLTWRKAGRRQTSRL